MKNMLRCAQTAFLGITLAAASPTAQSLGDLAKKTAADREKARATGGAPAKDAKDATPAAPKKTYTDDDLKKLASSEPGSTVAPNTPAATTTKTGEADAKDATATPATPGSAPEVKDEAWWKAHAKALDQQLEADQTLLAAAIRHMDGLASELRPSEISIMATARDLHAAEAEVTRLSAVVANDKRAKADLEEDARRANVHPGWLRWR